MGAATGSGCPLCREDGGLLIARRREVPRHPRHRSDAADCPGFYRVVWNDHVAEFSDLAEADQLLCLRAVSAVERAMLRERLQPRRSTLPRSATWCRTCTGM